MIDTFHFFQNFNLSNGMRELVLVKTLSFAVARKSTGALQMADLQIVLFSDVVLLTKPKKDQYILIKEVREITSDIFLPFFPLVGMLC
jgi:hypothetical protein